MTARRVSEAACDDHEREKARQAGQINERQHGQRHASGHHGIEAEPLDRHRAKGEGRHIDEVVPETQRIDPDAAVAVRPRERRDSEEEGATGKKDRPFGDEGRGGGDATR